MYTWKEKKEKTNPLFIEYPESFHYLPWCVGTSGPQRTRDERSERVWRSAFYQRERKKRNLFRGRSRLTFFLLLPHITESLCSRDLDVA
jgi:hypothetical protein